MFKILLNCSTLMKGGSLQVARSVFEEAIKDIEIEWFFAINKSQYLLVEDLLNTVLKKERLLILEDSPARSKQKTLNPLLMGILLMRFLLFLDLRMLSF